MDSKSTTKIKQQLNTLIDLPLRTFTRAGSMGDLGFGADVTKTIRTFDENHNIVKITVSVPQFILHLDCHFRLSCGNEILLSRGDIFQPSDILLNDSSFDYETFLWDAPNANRFDTIASQYFGKDSFSCVVDKISLSALGDLKIHFSNSFLLEVSPDISGNEECWRFFEQKNDDHLIVGGMGIIAEDDCAE